MIGNKDYVNLGAVGYITASEKLEQIINKHVNSPYIGEGGMQGPPTSKLVLAEMRSFFETCMPDLFKDFELDFHFSEVTKTANVDFVHKKYAQNTPEYIRAMGLIIDALESTQVLA